VARIDVRPRKIEIFTLNSNIIKNLLKILSSYCTVVLGVNWIICDNNAMKHDKLCDIIFGQTVIQRYYELMQKLERTNEIIITDYVVVDVSFLFSMRFLFYFYSKITAVAVVCFFLSDKYLTKFSFLFFLHI